MGCADSCNAVYSEQYPCSYLGFVVQTEFLRYPSSTRSAFIRKGKAPEM